MDGRTAVINNRDAGSREQVSALLATADALVEANQGAVLPLPRQLVSPHAAGLSRHVPLTHMLPSCLHLLATCRYTTTLSVDSLPLRSRACRSQGRLHMSLNASAS